jgi:hypothetical protein
MTTGTRTPNMSIYKPSVGEQVYDPAFAAGLDKVDAHDHSGAPDKGVQIGTDGIQDGSITPAKLSNEIIVEVTVQTTDATPTEAVAIPIIDSQAITVEGRFVGIKSDSTEAVGGNFLGVFYFPTGSTSTIVQLNIVNVLENSTGTPTLTLVANTSGGSEAISIRAVGEVGKTIDWHIAYNIIKQPE